MTRTWRELLALADSRLEHAGGVPGVGGSNEGRWLVERASGFEGSEFMLGLDEPASERAESFFLDMLDRRTAGEPLQYVLGRWGFRRLDLFIDKRVLIPRPETEMVVQVALAELQRASVGIARPTAVDLGTGSGAIALSIALEAPSTRVWATDTSSGAIDVARGNLAGLGTLAGTRVRIEHGSWFDPLPPTLQGHVHLVVANPPYIADDEELPTDVEAWEPREALRAGPTGLEHIELIVKESRTWLAEGSALVLELAPHQAMAAVRLAVEAGFPDVETRLDLSGRERMLVARS